MFFDAVRTNKRVVQIFLALITLPFAFWGVDSYVRNMGAGSDLASVGDSKITMPQFDQAWRAQQERMRQALGANFRPEAMNTPAAKLAVLNSLIDQRLLLLEAAKGRLAAGDDQLRAVIGKIPALQENGQFSLARYQAVLAAQGMSQAQFEGQLRQDLTLQQLIAAIGETSIVGDAVLDRLLHIQAEERQIAESRITPEQFAGQVKVDTESVRKYYEENGKRFEVAEQARVEYVVLSLEGLLAQVKPADAEVSAWYDSHKDRYQQAEEKRASHILIATGSDVEQAKQAKAKADEVLKEVQKSPARFAELARQYSQDPGSADKGGDLGFFARGTMVKPFEEAAFKLRESDAPVLVQSDFGYHIIKVTGSKPGRQRALAEVRPEIEEELKRQTASRQFAESAEAFSNMVYEQPDSLQPAAERFKLKSQQSGWLPRNATQEMLPALGQLGNQKVLAAVFSEDSLKNRRNTEVVEIAPNTLLAARVVDYRPASVKPLEAVKADIEAALKTREEAALARAAGESRLRELQQGADDKVAWATIGNVSRQETRRLPPAALKAIFKGDVSKLPAYVGAEVGGGTYALFRITKVSYPEKVDDGRRKALQREYGTILGQEDFAAYLAGLRQRYKIDINRSALESKER
ncbi:MAG TPA: SurA N-terminal domain-containing protein [Accumulibacter sp.]|uniref:SurA N-terminal domain-containing protein n=1 Tax=Accumulibacter sp. TaxID=2053492 RepID=UPI0025EC8312|nr:SurA N-terminal domain-containing protein [Accumulibacter sp.]MCM8600286.1 SurA N-terminal domain-containing protein [Accumulibacter sp.]MCM8664519.1 SurA N-terminal domain-containing protein [Accumulibacter sp.]HNC51463.1 SurA N-terminal domain-containing protein [Accumulibacter sp.]